MYVEAYSRKQQRTIYRALWHSILCLRYSSLLKQNGGRPIFF